MKDKLLSVYVNDKEVYYVIPLKRCRKQWYIICDENNVVIDEFTIDLNAYINAIQLALNEHKGNCIAFYSEETIIFENYEVKTRINKISAV